MDVLAVKQACRFAKEYAVKNGPIVRFTEFTVLSTLCHRAITLSSKDQFDRVCSAIA